VIIAISLMDKHALAILHAAESWSWPPTLRIQDSGKKTQDGKKAVTPKLLSGFIIESIALGGTLLDQFWLKVGGCHPKLIENSGLRSFSYECISKLVSFRS
jgi:hypothetical protein